MAPSRGWQCYKDIKTQNYQLIFVNSHRIEHHNFINLMQHSKGDRGHNLLTNFERGHRYHIAHIPMYMGY
jgi:pyrroloquinoline quinone (PQQ) biosynthesis protein C